ncbi:MAG TPA: ThuA domain-containing protein, partial [Chitinophagaceae bacterium]|nr:ThuA domain-containing protein [Chitinophagaceae bacterium]
MKKVFLLSLPLIFLYASCTTEKNKPRVLVFSKTTGYRHACIPKGKLAIQKLGVENNFDVDTTEMADVFNENDLKKYAAVIFLCTTQDVLKDSQQIAFERFIQAGGGFAGIHSAADTEYDWGWYGDLCGAWFESHPEIQAASINVINNSHSSTKHLPATWNRTDEWYNYK